MASEYEKALAAQYAGNGTMYMPPTSVNDMYAGIYPTQQPRTNPLAPSQGGSWPTYPQRPVSTALTPQNYNPTALPPDPSKQLASGQLPFINYPPRSPIDITVGTAGAPTQTASVPMPQRRPWDAPTSMDLAAIAGQGQPVASAYAPSAQTPAAVSAIAGLSPLTASERINQSMPGQPAPYASPRDMTRAEMYDATNKASAEAARTRDRSGFGTDGYVRNASGDVIGRDAKYQGLTPSQMYDQINGRPVQGGGGSPYVDPRTNALRPAGAVGDGIGPSGGDRQDEARRARARAIRAGEIPLPELRPGMNQTGAPASLADAMTRGSMSKKGR